MSTPSGSNKPGTSGRGASRRRYATRSRSTGSVRSRLPPSSTTIVACPTNVSLATPRLGEVAGVDQIAVERGREGVRLRRSPLPVQPIRLVGDLIGHLVQLSIEALEDVVAEDALVPVLAAAAAQPYPHVRVAGLAPGHRIHEIGAADGAEVGLLCMS